MSSKTKNFVFLIVYIFLIIGFPQLVYYFERYQKDFFQDWIYFIKYPMIVFGLIGFLYVLIRKRKCSWKQVMGIGAIIFLMDCYIVWNSNFYIPLFWSIYCSVWHVSTGVVLTVLLFRYCKTLKFSFLKSIAVTVGGGSLVILLTEMITGVYFDNGCFDQADIAYSLWGILAGFIVYLGVFENNRDYLFTNYSIRHNYLKEYFTKPFSFFMVLAVYVFFYVFISSKLTSPRYYFFVPFFTFFATLVVYLVVHLWTQKRRYLIIGVAGAILVSQIFSFVKYRNDGIVFNAWGVTIYKGVPILFFDYVIYPNGWVRLIDKKHDFSRIDQKMIREVESDVVIFGTGSHGLGGKEILGRDFWKDREVFILKSKDAVKLYNQLIQVGRKKIVLIMHNTC